MSNKKKTITNRILLFLNILAISSCSNFINKPEEDKDTIEAASSPIEFYFPIPSESQLKWQESELAMFIHFGINTFTGNEWGDGTDSPEIFNPSEENFAELWVKVAKETGFKYVILTAKHHDGFCLWPSKYTDYSIKHSPYKNGKGDIVKDFADACRKYDIGFGFYLSPWDRHEETYGSDEYNLYFQKQLIELLTNYGDVSEVWFDGANGEGPNGKVQVYDWELFYSTIRFYQPDALIAIAGPDIRWIGNETGLGKETEWCIQNQSHSIQPVYNNKVWYPSECDVSIRPRWFYHPEDDLNIKAVEKLTEIYFKSVGRNSNLLLNVPPNTEGVFSNLDIKVLEEWKNHLDNIFSVNKFFKQTIESSNTRYNSEEYSPNNCLDDNNQTFWVTDKNITSAELLISLNGKVKINIIRLQEAIEYGQRVKLFQLFYEENGLWKSFYDGTTIGRNRIITFDAIETNKIKLVIVDSHESPTLRSFEGFYYDS